MRSFPPLHTRHLTPTQLETARLQLLNVLTSDLSVNTKRISFFSFFQHLITEKYRNLYRSYFLEFANWIPLLTENIANCGWEPRALLLFLRIIELFIRHIDKQTDQMYKLRNKVLTAAIMANLYIGEIEIAAKIAGIDADIIQGKISKCEAQSELKRALFFLDLLEKLEREQNYDISVFIKKWQNLDTYSPNSTPILLVEQIDNASGPLQNTGIITALNGSIRERPSDADQDLISLNNRIHYDKDAIYWSLLDGVAAARSCLGYMNKTRQTYTLQFSMPEKNAIYTGNSIGAPAALLVYALICNRYYRTNFFHLAGLTVITGAIRPNGKILAVDSSGLKSKLKAVFFSPFSRVIVPMENHIEAAQYITKLKKHYPKRHLIIEGIDHLSQALQNRNLTKIEKISTTKKVIGRIKRLPNKYFLFAYTLTLGLLLLLFTFILPGKKGQPANYQVLDGQLRVFDENNVFLWAYDFETQFSTKVYEVGSYNPIIIKDIDHDGKKDILFGTYDNDNANFSGRVWRFDDRGNVVWKRKVGQAVKFGGEIFQDHFRVAQIFVRDLDKNGENEIIQIAYNYPDYPQICQVTDIHGNVLNQYWHAGQTNSINFKDFNKDGTEEIILGGQNNEYHDAVLAVLDFHHLSGCSPQTPESPYYPDSLSFGTEMYYIRFPATVFRSYGYRDQVFNIQLKNDGLTVSTINHYPYKEGNNHNIGGMIFYYFDNYFRFLKMPGIGDNYQRFLQQHLKISSNKINMDVYQKVLFWDGENWSTTPCVNNNWTKANKELK